MMRFKIGFLILILSLTGFILAGCKQGADEQTQLPKEETGKSGRNAGFR